MREFTFFLILGILASCSSSPFREESKQQDMVNKHLSMGVKYLEGEFDEKYRSSGRDGAYLKAIGSAIYPAGSSQKLVESAAVSNSKFRLVSSAPSEFKKEVYQAISSELGGVGEFSETAVSVTEVRNLTGIKSKFEDVQCRTKVSPTAQGSYKTELECRAVSSIKMSELKRAYDYTVQKKYGVKKSKLEKRLKQQLRSTASQ